MRTVTRWPIESSFKVSADIRREVVTGATQKSMSAPPCPVVVLVVLASELSDALRRKSDKRFACIPCCAQRRAHCLAPCWNVSHEFRVAAARAIARLSRRKTQQFLHELQLKRMENCSMKNQRATSPALCVAGELQPGTAVAKRQVAVALDRNFGSEQSLKCGAVSFHDEFIRVGHRCERPSAGNSRCDGVIQTPWPLHHCSAAATTSQNWHAAVLAFLHVHFGLDVISVTDDQ